MNIPEIHITTIQVTRPTFPTRHWKQSMLGLFMEISVVDFVNSLLTNSLLSNNMASHSPFVFSIGYTSKL